MIRLGLLAGLGFLAACARPAKPPEGVVSADEKYIYYESRFNGSPARTHARRAGVVAAWEVFQFIPAYEPIRRGWTDESDPEYWVAICRANERFQEAVGRIASRRQLDIVAERGYPFPETLEGPPEEVTLEVIDEIRSMH